MDKLNFRSSHGILSFMTRTDCRWSCMSKKVYKMIFRKAEKEDFNRVNGKVYEEF